MATRDYFAKGWPAEGAVVEQAAVKTGETIGMFQFVEFTAGVSGQAGYIVVKPAAAAASKVFVAVDASTAFDVVSSGKLPVWLNVAGKIVVTPHVDTTSLSVGDLVEVKAAGVLQKKASNPAVGQVLELLADGDVRVLLF